VNLFQNLPDLSEEQYSQAFQAISSNLPLHQLPSSLKDLSKEEWLLLDQLLYLLLEEKKESVVH
jgi:hypothetical protein